MQIIKKIIKYSLSKFDLKLSKANQNLQQLFFQLQDEEITNNYFSKDYFISDNNEKLFINKNYRYTVKPCWKAFPILINFYHLQNCGVLSKNEKKQFDKFIGKNTLTSPLEQIHKYIEPILKRNQEFFDGTEYPKSRYWVPKLPDVYFKNQIKKMKKIIFRDLQIIRGLSHKKIVKVLDVGCGRGVSTAAFSELGMKVTGIDSNYGNKFESSIDEMQRMRIRKINSSSYNIIFDDIRKCNSLKKNTFDFIYSISCLEHIQKLDKAISEMYRLLNPGGLMMHHLNPIWCENGGHALGTLDSPWLHVVLNEKEFERYLKEIHPFESDIAIPWSKKSLNRGITINSLQRLLIKNGFTLLHWSETIGNTKNIKFLNRDTLLKIQKNYNDVSLADLLATNITFVARKSL